VRWLLLGLIAVAVAVPASAANVNPKMFTLSQADVPSGYFFDRDNSVLLSKAAVDHASNEESRFLRSIGFEGAYFAAYLNSSPPKWRFVNSAAFVFRGASGARAFVRAARKAGQTPFTQRAVRVRLGDEAWLSEDASEPGSTVAWRQGRVAAYVSCREMVGHRALALALARKQQRRIVARTR
jgi:hypothetical protein